MSENGQTVSLSQAAYERIKQKIVSLELAPGSVIDEVGLRNELDLGRTPIREALKRLSLEKLVNIVPRRGMFVTDIGVMDLQRLFEVRVELEGLAAQLAAQRGTAEHWTEMDAALSKLDIASRQASQGNQANNEVLINIDRACHEIIYTAANNEFLEDILVTMYALSLRLWYFALSQIGDMQGAVREHRAIAEALKSRDGERAATLTRQHIKAFQEEIQSVMLGSG